MFDRIKSVSPDPKIMQLALAELVVAVEKLHKANITHRDLGYQNILVDSDGHLVVIDFGHSVMLSSDGQENCDWKTLSFNFDEEFSKLNRSEIQTDLIKMLENMSDAQIPGKYFTVNVDKNQQIVYKND